MLRAAEEAALRVARRRPRAAAELEARGSGVMTNRGGRWGGDRWLRVVTLIESGWRRVVDLKVEG